MKYKHIGLLLTATILRDHAPILGMFTTIIDRIAAAFRFIAIELVVILPVQSTSIVRVINKREHLISNEQHGRRYARTTTIHTNATSTFQWSHHASRRTVPATGTGTSAQY